MTSTPTLATRAALPGGPDGRRDARVRWTCEPAREDPRLCEERLWEELERTLLRVEFEAIIAANYPPVADEPRPVPPVHRVRTDLDGDLPVRGDPPTDGSARLAGSRHGVAVGIGPRERGPPRSGRWFRAETAG
jgi:hypothetical protein